MRNYRNYRREIIEMKKQMINGCHELGIGSPMESEVVIKGNRRYPCDHANDLHFGYGDRLLTYKCTSKTGKKSKIHGLLVSISLI